MRSLPTCYRFPRYLLLPLLFLLSCSSTEPVTVPEPVQQKKIDRSEYFDPYKNLDGLQDYTLPELKDGLMSVRFPYPEEARRKGIQGIVILRLYIDESGVVQNADIEKPLTPLIDYSAQRIMLDQIFIPAKMNGKPIKSSHKFPVVYRLNVEQ